MQGLDIGTVVFTTGLDLSGIKSDIKQAQSMLSKLDLDLKVSVPKLQTLTPKVNLKELHSLNKTFDLKVAHSKQVQRYFDANPLRPKVDSTELKELSALLEGAKGKRKINISASYAFDKTSLELLKQIARNTRYNTEATKELSNSFSKSSENRTNIELLKQVAKNTRHNKELTRGLSLSLSKSIEEGFRKGSKKGPVQAIGGAVSGGVMNLATLPFKMAFGAVSAIATDFRRGFIEKIGAGAAENTVLTDTNRAAKKLARTFGEATSSLLDLQRGFAAFSAELLSKGKFNPDVFIKESLKPVNDAFQNLKIMASIAGGSGDLGKLPQNPDELKKALVGIQKDQADAIVELYKQHLKRIAKIEKQSPTSKRIVKQAVDATLDDLVPRDIVTSFKKLGREMKPFLELIADIQSFVILDKAKSQKDYWKATLPDLKPGQKNYMMVFPGAQGRGGYGGQQLANAFGPMFPHTAMIPLQNQDQDRIPEQYRNLSDANLARLGMRRRQGFISKLAERLQGQIAEIDTLNNVITQIEDALNPVMASTASVQAMSTYLALKEKGVSDANISALGYSLAGADVLRFNRALSLNDSKLSGNTNPTMKSVAMAYPYFGLTNPSKYPNFQSYILESDALSFPHKRGFSYTGNDRRFSGKVNAAGYYDFGLRNSGSRRGSASAANQQNLPFTVIEDTAGAASGFEKHAYKHIMKRPQFQDVLRGLSSDFRPLDKDFVAKNDQLYESLAALDQVKSILSTGKFDTNSPFKMAFDRTMGEVDLIAKVLEPFATGGGFSKAEAQYMGEDDIRGMLLAFKAEVEAIFPEIISFLKRAGMTEDFSDPAALFDAMKGRAEQKEINRSIGAIRGEKFDEQGSWFLPRDEQGKFHVPSIQKNIVDIKNAIDFFDNVSTPVLTKVKKFYENIRDVMREIIDTGDVDIEKLKASGMLNNLEYVNFGDELQLSSNQSLDFGTLPTQRETFQFKGFNTPAGNFPVPEWARQNPASMVAYNNLGKNLAALPSPDDIERVAYGWSGAASFIGKNHVFKYGSPDEQFFATQQELDVYNKLQGRYSPVMLSGEVGKSLVLERIQGQSAQDLLLKRAKPIRDMQEQAAELQKQLGQAQSSKNQPEIDRLQASISNINQRIASATALYNQYAEAVYLRIGQLESTLLRLGVAHNDLATGNVFFTDPDALEGVTAIDFGRSMLNPTALQAASSRSITMQRMLVNRELWGIINQPRMARGLMKGWRQPMRDPGPRNFNIPLPPPGNAQFELGTIQQTPFDYVIGNQRYSQARTGYARSGASGMTAPGDNTAWVDQILENLKGDLSDFASGSDSIEKLYDNAEILSNGISVLGDEANRLESQLSTLEQKHKEFSSELDGSPEAVQAFEDAINSIKARLSTLDDAIAKISGTLDINRDIRNQRLAQQAFVRDVINTVRAAGQNLAVNNPFSQGITGFANEQSMRVPFADEGTINMQGFNLETIDQLRMEHLAYLSQLLLSDAKKLADQIFQQTGQRISVAMLQSQELEAELFAKNKNLLKLKRLIQFGIAGAAVSSPIGHAATNLAGQAISPLVNMAIEPSISPVAGPAADILSFMSDLLGKIPENAPFLKGLKELAPSLEGGAAFFDGLSEQLAVRLAQLLAGTAGFWGTAKIQKQLSPAPENRPALPPASSGQATPVRVISQPKTECCDNELVLASGQSDTAFPSVAELRSDLAEISNQLQNFSPDRFTKTMLSMANQPVKLDPIASMDRNTAQQLAAARELVRYFQEIQTNSKKMMGTIAPIFKDFKERMKEAAKKNKLIEITEKDISNLQKIVYAMRIIADKRAELIRMRGPLIQSENPQVKAVAGKVLFGNETPMQQLLTTGAKAVSETAQAVAVQAMIAKTIPAQFRSAGENSAIGYAEGFDSSIQLVRDSVGQGTQSLIDTAKDILKIRSPSKVFEWIGNMINKGLEVGTSNAPHVWDRMKNSIQEYFDMLQSKFPIMRKLKNLLLDIAQTALIGLGLYSIGDAIVEFGRFAIQTSTDFERLQVSITSVSESAAAAESNIASIYDSARDFSQDLNSLMQGGANIFAAARGTALEGYGDQQIIETMAQASLVRQLNADQVQRSMVALEQMISKGNVSSEELRKQLSEALPGAFQIAARSMGMTTGELNRMLEQGELLSTDFLPRFMEQLSAETASGVAGASQTAQAKLNAFNNSMTIAAKNLGDQIAPVRNFALELGTVGFEILGSADAVPKLLTLIGLLTFKIAAASGAFVLMGKAIKAIDFAAAGRGILGLTKQLILLNTAVEVYTELTRRLNSDGSNGLATFAEKSRIDLGLEAQTEQINIFAKAWEKLAGAFEGKNIVDIGGRLANVINPFVRGYINLLTDYKNVITGQGRFGNPFRELITQQQKEMNDWLVANTDQMVINVPALLNQVRQNMNTVPQLTALDQRISTLVSQRDNLPPGSRDQRNDINDQIAELNRQRQKLQAPLAQDQSMLQSFIDNSQSELERIEQQLLDPSITDQNRRNLEAMRANTKGALDDLLKIQGELQSIIRENMDAMALLAYNSERATWALNQQNRQADRAAEERSRNIVAAQAQGTLGQPFADVLQSRSELIRVQNKTTSALREIENLQDQMQLPQFAEVLKNLQVNISEIENVDLAKLQAQGQTDYGKTPEAQNAIKTVERYQQMVQQYESDLTALYSAQKSLFDANLALARTQEDMAVQERDFRLQMRDIGFQVQETGWQIDDYFFNLRETVRNIQKTFEDAIIQAERSAADNIFEIKRIALEMSRRDSRNNFRLAIARAEGTLVSGLVQSVADLFDSMFEFDSTELEGNRRIEEQNRQIQDIERARIDFKFAMEAQTRQLEQMPRQLEQIIRSSLDLKYRIEDATRSIDRARQDFLGLKGTLEGNLQALNQLRTSVNSGIVRLANIVKEAGERQPSTSNPPALTPVTLPPPPPPIIRQPLNAPMPEIRQQGIGAGTGGLVDPFNPPPPPAFGINRINPIDALLPPVDRLSNRIGEPPHPAGNLRFHNPLTVISDIRRWMNTTNPGGIEDVNGFKEPIQRLIREYGESRAINLLRDLLVDPKTNKGLRDAINQQLTDFDPFSPRKTKMRGVKSREYAREQQFGIPQHGSQPGLSVLGRSLVNQRPDAFGLNTEEGRARLAIAMAIAGTESRGSFGNANLDLGSLYSKWGGWQNKMKGPFQIHTGYWGRDAATMQSQNNFIADILMGNRRTPDSKQQADFGAELVSLMRSGQISNGGQFQSWLGRRLGYDAGGRNWQALSDGFNYGATGLQNSLFNWMRGGGGQSFTPREVTIQAQAVALDTTQVTQPQVTQPQGQPGRLTEQSWKQVHDYIQTSLRRGDTPEQIGQALSQSGWDMSLFGDNTQSVQQNTQAVQSLTATIQGPPTDRTPFNQLAGIHVPVQPFTPWQGSPEAAAHTSQLYQQLNQQAMQSYQQGRNQVATEMQPFIQRHNAIAGSINIPSMMQSYDQSTNNQLSTIQQLIEAIKADTASQQRTNELETEARFIASENQMFQTIRQFNDLAGRAASERFNLDTMFLPTEGSLAAQSELVQQAEQLRSSTEELTLRLRELQNAQQALMQSMVGAVQNLQDPRISPERRARIEQEILPALAQAYLQLPSTIGAVQSQLSQLQSISQRPGQLYLQNLDQQIYQGRVNASPGASWMFSGEGQRIAEERQIMMFEADMRNASATAQRLGLDVKEVESRIIELNQLRMDEIDREFKGLGEVVTEQMSGPIKNFLGELIKGTITIEEAFQQLISSLLDMFTNLFTEWLMGSIMQMFGGDLFGIFGGGGGKGVASGGGGGLFGGGGGLFGIIGNLFGGIFGGGFAQGGQIPGKGIASLLEIEQAMKREGPNAVLATLTPGEQVLPVHNGEAQLYRRLFPEGIKEAYENRHSMARVPQYSRGGMVGSDDFATGRTMGRGNTSNINIPITINANNQGDQSQYDQFAKSLRPDLEKLVDKRMQEAQRPGGILFSR